MAKPERFDREGIYIWRDAGGVWNISSITGQALQVTVDLSAEAEIQPVGERAAAIKKSSPGKARVDEIQTPGNRSAPFRFRASGSYVDFGFLINGKCEPEHLYLGRQSWNPQSASFRIENRPLDVSGGSQEQTAATGGLAGELIVPDTPTSSGGGGGGPPPK